MRRRAVTLAEVVFSFALVLLIVLFVFELYPMALASVRASGQRSQALSLADSLLSDAMQEPFRELPVGEQRTLPAVPGMATEFHATLETFAPNQAGTDPARLIGIRVTVYWTRGRETLQIVREQWRTNVQR